MQLMPLTEERLDDLTELWNRTMGEFFPMRTELFKQNSFSDVNVFEQGSWMAVDEQTNRVVGFIISKIYQEQDTGIILGDQAGWIQALLVDAEYRNQGIGLALFQKAESALSAKGVKKIILGRDPWHYFPGVPDEFAPAGSWFEKRGFTYINTVYDLNHDARNNEAEPLKMEGVTFRLLQVAEKDEFLSFLRRCFPGRWEYEAYKYFERGGTGREFVVLERDGRIIGFCRINDQDSAIIAQNVYWAPLYQGNLGGIGPLGIDREYRKNGYGLAIVQAALYFLKSRGIRQFVIDWTELVEFYQKLGFNVCNTFYQYEKQVVGSKME